MKPQHYMKNSRQLRNVESGRHGLPQERPLVTQYQMVIQENMHTSSLMHTEQVLFGDIPIHTQTFRHVEFITFLKHQEQ